MRSRASSSPTPSWPAATPAGLTRVEDLLHREVHSDYPFVTETSLHLIDAGGKRFRPLFTLLGGADRPAAGRRRRDHRGRRGRADPPGHALPRRRDGLGHHAARGARAPTPAGTTRSPSSPATSCSRTRPGSSPTSARTRCGSSPRRSPSWSPGQMRETRGPRPARTRSQHYLTVVAEKTGSLIATVRPLRRHVLRLPAGAGGGAAPVRRDHRHRVPDLRRRHRHRLAVGQLRQDARHRPARGRAHAARCSTRCRTDGADADGCASCWPARSPTTPRSTRRSTLLRTGPGLAQARDVLAEQAAAARAELAKLPPCAAVDALAALTTYVVDRTG